jgi:RHS repeat-associated protein
MNNWRSKIMTTKDRPKRSEVQTPGLVATQKQRAVSHSAARPVIEGRRMPGNIYKPRKKGPPKGNLPSNVLAATAPGFASNRVAGAQSVEELARALKNDVDLIYNFVHDNIEFIPTFGSQKGALGTLIDGFGNAFDQSELMIALLREGSWTCSFQFGELQLTAAQAAAWLGNDPGSIWAASNLLGNLGVPNETSWTGSQWVLRLSHCWVKVLIGGNYYHFDPAMKAYTRITGVDLATVIDYDRSDFMSDATTGATVTSNYVENMNRTNVRNNLATLAGNLVDYLKENEPTATLDDILGGRTINKATTQVRQTSLPYLRPATTPTTWTDIPNNYKATLSVLYDTIDVSFYSRDIHGKRLTLFFNSSHEAELRLDGDLIATSDAQTPDSWNSVLLSITHPYPYTWWDQSFWQTVWEGKPYLIAQAWGNAGREMVEVHRQKLSQAIFDGSAADSEVVLGETLAVRWNAWNSQKSWACDVFNRMTQCTTVLQHQVGMVGWFDTPLMDLGGIVWSSGALDNNYDNVNTNDTALAMHGIAFEAGTIEQICGIGGISTTTILDKAVQDGLKIYHGRSDNWTASVRPNLTNYSSYALDDIENWYLNWGWKVAIPEDGEIAVQDFRGFGYYAISPWQGAIGIFSGYLKGGMGAVGQTISDMVPNTRGASIDPDSDTLPHCTSNTSADPIDMHRGTYLYNNQDITAGSGTFPYGIGFERYYNSGARLSNGPLGLGWNHNWNHRLSVNSDGLACMSFDSPLSGASGLVAMFVTMDLYRDLDKPIDKWVTAAMTNRWLLDQSRNNTVFVSLPGDTQVFVKQPDGSFIAPAGEAATLVKNGGGDWTYTNKHQVVTSYDSAGKITEIAYPEGVTLTFTYDAGKLVNVSNGLTRELDFTYDGDKLVEVTAGGRSVRFAYDDEDLVTATDPENEDTTYVYDIPGRMTQMFRPANPADAIMTNVYDTLGRVQTQTDGSGNVWTYYFAGSRTEEKNPANNSRVQYFDGGGNVILEVNALGFKTKNEYDGLGRLIQITFDEGNKRLFTYDSNNNVLTETDKPKPGSSDPDIVKTFTYNATFNKVETAEDGNSNVTSFEYDPVTGLLEKKTFPEVDSVEAEINYTYNGRGQVLTITDQEGMVTTFVYDASDETLTSVTRDSGGGRLNLQTQFAYNDAGDVTTITDPRGNATTFSYDDMRRLKQITPPSPFAANVTKYTYDKNGNRTKVERYAGTVMSTAVWQTVNATYTVDNLLATLTDPSSHVTEMTYNSLRKLWKREDGESRITTLAYDEVGRLSTVTDPSNTVCETRTYTNNGLVATIKDARNKVTAFEYDGFDRLKKRTFEDDTFESFARDANGNVLTKVTRLGDDIVFVYDELNRLRQKSPDGMPTVTYEYDLANRLFSVATPVVGGDPSSGTIEFGYDTAGRRIREEYPDGKTVSLELDENSNIKKVTYPDGYYVQRTFDQLNQLKQVKLNGASTAALDFGYDTLGRRTSLAYVNGTSTAYGYQLNDLITSLTQTYDSASVAFTYGYNGAHEMESQGVSNSAYMRHPSGGGTVSYATANDVNEYPSVASVSYGYNANGCLTSDGVWTFGYDTENHLVSAAKTAVSASYLYDPLGRQTQKTVNSVKTRFIYVGHQRLADYDGSNNLIARYVYGAGLDEPLLVVDDNEVVVAHLHHDRLGSIVAVTDANGDPTSVNKYMPWGEGTVSGTTFGFTGQRYDAESGLYYFKNRYYSPTLGRFLQPDPVLYADSLNTYVYGRNNPLSMTDPYGLSADVDQPWTRTQLPSLVGSLGTGGIDESRALANSGSCTCECDGGGSTGVNTNTSTSTGNGSTGTGGTGTGGSTSLGDGTGSGGTLYNPWGQEPIYIDGLYLYNNIVKCYLKCSGMEGVLKATCISLCLIDPSA